MISQFISVFSRSRRYLAQDAIGVTTLFVMLIGALNLAAL